VPVTHDITKHLFWHMLRLDKKSPLHHVQRSYEIQGPFRISYTHVYRLPLTTFAIAVGYWLDEEDSGHHESLRARVNGQLQATSDVHILDAIDGVSAGYAAPEGEHWGLEEKPDTAQEAREVPGTEKVLVAAGEQYPDSLARAYDYAEAKAAQYRAEDAGQPAGINVTTRQQPLQEFPVAAKEQHASGGAAFDGDE